MNHKTGLIGLMLVLILGAVFAAPWDSLRGPTGVIELVEPLVVWLLLIVSAAVMVVAVLAVRKKYSARLAWVSAAFGLFFIKSLLIVLDLYFSPGNFVNYSIQSLFDLVAIGCLFIALFRK